MALTIHTPRLEIVAGTVESLTAAKEKASLEKALNCSIEGGWPPEALGDALDDFIELAHQADGGHWLPFWWIWVEGDSRKLVGNGGFFGDPRKDGFTEIGFETQEAFQRKGFAKEAASALVAWALQQNEVGFVQAHTYTTNLPALRLLGNIGFTEIDREDDLVCLGLTRDSVGEPVEAIRAFWAESEA